VQPIKDAEGKDVRFGFPQCPLLAAGATLYGSQAQMARVRGKPTIRSSATWRVLTRVVECPRSACTQVRVMPAQRATRMPRPLTDLKNNREPGSLADYDGDGDTKEACTTS